MIVIDILFRMISFKHEIHEMKDVNYGSPGSTFVG